MWIIIRAGIWLGGETTQEKRDTIALTQFRSSLHAWYRVRHDNNPEEKLTRVHDMTIKMIGSPTQPTFKFSGAETWGLMLFMTHCLRVHSAVIGHDIARPLGEGGEMLVRYIEVVRAQPMNVTPPVIQDHRKTVVPKTARAVRPTPKGVAQRDKYISM